MNSLLNYGYGILYGRVHEAIVKAGLNPNIGLLHAPAKGRPSLVYDLIEPFRAPVVDRAILALLTKEALGSVTKEGRLDDATRSRAAARVTRRLRVPFRYRGRHTCLVEIIQRQALELARYLEGKQPTFRPYAGKW